MASIRERVAALFAAAEMSSDFLPKRSALGEIRKTSGRRVSTEAENHPKSPLLCHSSSTSLISPPTSPLPAGMPSPTSRPKTPRPASIPLPSSISETITSSDPVSPNSSSHVTQPSSSDADISSNSDPFTSPRSAPHRRRLHKNHRALKEGSMTLGDIAGHDLMSQTTFFKPNTTLCRFVNFIIEHNVLLPTEDEINGDRAWNAAECEWAASIPLEPRPSFTEEKDDSTEFCRANPRCGQTYRNDLMDIGAESLYYEDPVTGKMKKRFERFNTMEPQNAVKDGMVESAAEEAAMDGVRLEDGDGDEGGGCSPLGPENRLD
ncbi:MAG: hypothetical protein Q9170_000927 [Blastenia crenularia]